MLFQGTRFQVELLDEPTYTLGSRDNPTLYDAELRLEGEERPSSKHGLRCIDRGERSSSIIITAAGGATGVHTESCVLMPDRCVVVIGNQVVCLELPALSVLWHVRGDVATCYGLYLASGGENLVLHGECEISMLTPEGQRLWAFSGEDIFTGRFDINENVIEVIDFNGQMYCTNVRRGAGEVANAG